LNRILRLTMAGWAVIGLALACDSSESTLPEDAPPGHTVNQDGVAHAPGLNDPTENCTACHGADLRGGDAGQPSCYSCHGQEWP
jgi:hypothetical protein